MYPSGAWRGYWEQMGFGRQLMDDFTLRFTQGKIDGAGRDCVGQFTFTGTYDNRGTVALVKQYVGRHQVAYQGTYDGEGTIFGTWSIPPLWSGPFALTPVKRKSDGEIPIEEL
jgi:hypothetical protein